MLSKLKKICEETKEVSILREESSTLLNAASGLLNECSTQLNKMSDLIKKQKENKTPPDQCYGINDLSNQFIEKVNQANKNKMDAQGKENDANKKVEKIISDIISFSNQCTNTGSTDTEKNDEKEFWDNLKEFVESCQKRDVASQERDKASQERDENSKKIYKEVADVFDCQKNSKTLEEHKEKYFKKKKIYCYVFLGGLIIVWLFFAGNLFGFPLGIDIGTLDTPISVVKILLLCILLIFVICIIIVLARKLHRINKAIHKIDALILRTKLSTDRDLGKPNRLDRELDMIYRILES